jgi:multiple sugar transport system permease protein
VTIALSFPVGYSIARYKTGGKNLLFWILSLRISPPIVFIIPIYFLFQMLNLLDKQFGLILIYQTFNVPLAVWLFRSYVHDIPIDYEEAALIDGASKVQVLTRITLRLSLPAVIAVFVLAFIAAWNEYIFALILTITKSRTWSVGSQIFVGTYDIQWGELSAAAIVGIVPPLILAYLLRKRLIEGFTMGLLKG